MSQAFIKSFFPAVTTLIPETILQYLLPDDVALLCPESVIIINNETVVIRNPALAVAAIVGLLVGFAGARRYKHLWSAAFGCFGLMNAVAVPLHCWVVVPATNTSNLAISHPLLWILDCFFTGASSMALIAAGLGLCSNSNKQMSRPVRIVRRVLQPSFALRPTATAMQSWLQWNGLGVAAIGLFYSFTGGSILQTLALELWYLAPVVVAGQVLLPLIVMDATDATDTPNSASCRTAVVWVLAGVTCAVVGLWLDANLCRWTTAIGWETLDALTATTLVFAGCDMAFVGVGLWLDATVGGGGLERQKKS